MKKSVRVLWMIFCGGLGFFIILIAGFWWSWWGNMPSITELENPSSALSSEVLAADGSIMGRYFVQDRSNSKFSEINTDVFDALVATEDERFRDHSGIDGRATLRAVLLLGQEGGGSTITQQLAFNLFNGERAQNKIARGFQKLKEWVLAVKLERNLTKNEIITLYLNTVPFPDNVYGIKNASLTFFNKLPDKLTVPEAATLIGTLKGNTIYNPRSHAKASLARRNTVIEQMLKYDKITAADAAKYKAMPIVLDYHKQSYHEGAAPYFRQVLEKQVKDILKDIKKPGSDDHYNIYKDGLKIYTTIDPKMQEYAEQAVTQHMADLQKMFMQQSGYANHAVWKSHQNIIDAAIKQSDRYKMMKDADENVTDADIEKAFNTPVKMRVFAWNKNEYKDTVMTPRDSIMYTRMFLQAGFMAMDPMTGEVKAWVGGINHDFYQYDHVNENTKRQVGSTIKPLLYCLAVDNGISPCGIVSTAPQSFNGKLYNAGGSKFGAITMKKALALSINNAALYLIKQVGIPAFQDFVKRCGINSNIVPYPSIALGVSDISLFEMLHAYTMFPSGGINTEPYFISKIEDKNGILVKSFAPRQKEIISANTAYKMVKMMRGVVDFGTAKRLRYRYGIKADIAGKTGTTNDQSDGWFIGYSPQILAGGWVGCDDRFLRFRSEALGQGAAAALPIWALFYKKIASDKSLDIRSDAKFEEPANFDDCDVSDPNSAMRADYNNGGIGGPDESEKDINNDATLPPTSDWGNGVDDSDGGQ
ncbi:MAG: transglycosylase domain-containing protein [Chitinophagaceae bacterium]